MRSLAGIDAALSRAVEAKEVPGVVALAATEAGILYEGAFGLRDIADGPAMTRDSVFRIASMTKAVTSVAALQLVEQGKLSLDAPVPDIDPVIGSPQVLDGFDAKGVPQLRPAKRPISLRHLLTHTSGLSYRLWDAKAARYTEAFERLSAREKKQALRTPLMFDPGERWQYGPSIDWVGRIVESVSGEPVDTYFRNHIFDPLGMNDTAF
ncbi:MAG: beta-lactamase family protein, partial [Alphaproteobacteria bacterium]|nr:beta-lactamase family protein [Alphaproteobacteria bacterium]